MDEQKTFPTNALTEAPRARDLTKGQVIAAMLLDRSDSMRGDSATQLLEGAADFLEDLRELPMTTRLAFDQFAHDAILDTFDLVQEKPYLDRKRYKADGGGTAIYDNIFRVISHVEKEKRPQDRAVVVIFTDGQENASKKHGPDDTRKTILAKRAQGWSFYFLGPNRQFAEKLGIPHDHVFKLGDARGIRGALAQMCQTVVRGLLPAKGGTVHHL